MPANPPTDQRAYFRIQDRIGLEFRKLAPDADGLSDPFQDSQGDGLRAELRRLDLDVRSQLASLAERDRLLANLLKTLNGKVDTLARIMAFEQNPLQPEDWRPVTLSEGGVAFPASVSDIDIGDLLAIRMTLPPELFRPEAIAQVVEVTRENTDEPWLHTEFTRLHDSDRQQIAKHIMRWQIRHRQQNETGEP
ncbi:MAG: PilZ domain-containing protein [Marinobacter sp.]|uniref:PilZ domain-containing protein n=1 Tax=Marinobacter sp. TaxID=50741 RepID=UPI00299D6FEA|nr:PilZ domain-containing protein [Marinobacter sp.]MDX1633032.1 PilZ domain-containing protein [Marinobacter sp.]